MLFRADERSKSADIRGEESFCAIGRWREESRQLRRYSPQRSGIRAVDRRRSSGSYQST